MFRLALIVLWVAPVSTGLAAGLVAALAPAAAPEVPAKIAKVNTPICFCRRSLFYISLKISENYFNRPSGTVIIFLKKKLEFFKIIVISQADLEK
jgi:hypothetical protein